MIFIFVASANRSLICFQLELIMISVAMSTIIQLFLREHEYVLISHGVVEFLSPKVTFDVLFYL